MQQYYVPLDPYYVDISTFATRFDVATIYHVRALAKHLDNYSMMQVLLKLIVPQILTVSGGERARERHARGPPRAFRARQHEERTCVLTAARALLSLASD